MPSRTGGTDWTSMPETQLFTVTGTKKNKKGKTKNIYSPWTPPEGSAASGAPGSSVAAPAKGSAATAPPAVAPGTGGGHPATNPSVFDKGVGSGVVSAFPGSFASRYPDFQTNPAGANIVAQSPGLLANDVMAERYGLPAGSYSSELFSTYLNPDQKWMGLLNTKPTDNNDMINFGASLMGAGGSRFAPGTQLSPSGMMANMTSILKSEFQAIAKGGSGSSDVFNELVELAHTDPNSALTKFVDMARGMLTGTMPQDTLDAYLQFLTRIGSQFVQQWVHGDVGKMEANGQNFLSALMDRLGPSLGL